MANDGSVEIKIVGDDSDLKKKLGGIGSAAQTAAKATGAAIAGIGTALIGAGAYAVKVGADFEAGMSKVAAISGATGEELAQLEAKAKEMGATTKFSATESAEALQYMAMAGWKTQQMVDGLPGIMNLAAASGEDLASVSDIVTDALTAFGLQASDSAHFADVLAKASSSANTNVSMMGATFKYAAPLAGAMGYSIEDTALAIGLMANAGIKGEQAGTSLRTMFTKLSETAEGAGIQITDATGKMLPLSDVLTQLREKFAGLSEAEQIETATNLVGQEAMSGLLAIVNASASDYDKLADAITHADGAAKQQADTMNDNLKGALTLLGSNLEGVGIQIYDSLETPLKQAVQSANGSITTLSRSLSSGQLKGAMQTISKAIGDVVAALSKFAAQAIPKVITAVAGLIKNFDKIAVALKTAAAAFVVFKAGMTIAGLMKTWSAAVSTATTALQGYLLTQKVATAETALMTVAVVAKNAAVGILTGQIGLATAAQLVWNAAMTANPIGVVVAGMATLIAGTVALVSWLEKETDAEKQAREAMEARNAAIKARAESWEQMRAASQENVDASLSEIALAQQYVKELDNITDENGRVAAGYEGRAAALYELINTAIPGAVAANESEEGSIYKISDAIDEVIAKKKAQAVLDEMQDQYAEATQNWTKAQIELAAAERALGEGRKNGSKNLEELQAAYDAAKQTADSYMQTMSNFESITGAMEQGADAIELALADIQTNLKTAGAANVSELEEQAANIKAAYEAMQEQAASGDTSITESHLNTMRAMLDQANAELQRGLEEQNTATNVLMQDAMGDLAGKAGEGFSKTADAALQGYAAAMSAGAPAAAAESEKLKTMCEAALHGDTSTYGADFTRGYLLGILALNPSEEVRAMVEKALAAIPETQASNSPSKITEGYGGDFAKGYTEGIKGGADAAETAAGSMAQQAIAKLLGIASQAKQGGTQVTGNFTQGVSGGTPTALSVVGALAQQAAEKLLSIAPQFQTGGQQAVSQMQQGVEGNAGAAVGAVQSMANQMLSSARSVASSFLSVGINMAQGLMNGLAQMAGRVASTAANLAKSALNAAKSAVGIRSPSRDFREQVGRMMGMGMALGIGDSKETVKANIAMLSQMALEDARDKAKDFKEVGDLYVENLTYGVEKGRDAALDKFECWLDADVEKFKARKDATDEQKKSYEEAAKEVMSAYKDALNDGYDEALSTVKTRVSELTTAFKTQHDALIREQQAMQSKLAGFGDLFNIDKFGNLSLENIDKSIDAIERYDEALSALKDRGVSEDFMQQVTALGVEEGTKFAEKLANLPDEAFANYTAAWQEQQDLAKTVAEKFYADQLETLEADFAGKLDETLESVPNLLTNLGQDSIQGMIDGMYSKSGMLSAAASEIVSRAIRAMQAAADVNSPSKKTRDLVGKPLAEGIAVGFDRQMADVYRQVSQTLDGEILKLSADVKVQADRQAAKANPAPVQTVVKSTHTDRIAKITVDESKLNRLGRAFYDVIKIEEKRRGDNMVKGAT